MTDQLAMDGGPKVRQTPFPKRAPFGEEEVRLVTEAIRSQDCFRWSGHFVDDFERAFADFYGVPHAVASTSGTASIHVAVGALDPEPGDEIITAPITDLGTVVPILLQNAVPVFADVDATYNMDPEDVERRITPRTRAIIAVHLFGNPCNMDAMLDVARRHDLVLIEDCSQAHATKYKGQYLGTLGDIGCYSLQQSKHMTTGDGGMTITGNADLAARMALFADKGYRRRGIGPRGYTTLAPCYRMNEQTAALGLPQLGRVRERVEKRMALGNLLSDLIADIGGLRPAPRTPGGEHSYWAYALGVDDWPAERFAEALRAEGVPGNPGYIGKPIFMCAGCCISKATYGGSSFPFDSAYSDLQIEYDEALCPRTVEALKHMMTLGLNEAYTEEDVRDMAQAIRKVARLLPAGAA